jgi:hypothetical protein
MTGICCVAVSIRGVGEQIVATNDEHVLTYHVRDRSTHAGTDDVVARTRWRC